jgi:hypothetical protein
MSDTSGQSNDLGDQQRDLEFRKLNAEIEKLTTETAKLTTETTVLKNRWLKWGPLVAAILQTLAVLAVTFYGAYSAFETNFFSTKQERAEIDTSKAEQAKKEVQQEVADLKDRKLQITQDNDALKRQNVNIARERDTVKDAYVAERTKTSELRRQLAAGSVSPSEVQKKLEQSQARLTGVIEKLSQVSVVNIEPDSPLMFNAGVPSIKVKITVINNSRSPVIKVAILPELYPMPTPGGVALHATGFELGKVCDAALTTNAGFELALNVSRTAVYSLTGRSVAPNEFSMGGYPHMPFAVIGCVTYSSITTPTVRHQSSFSYLLVATGPALPPGQYYPAAFTDILPANIKINPLTQVVGRNN